MLFQPRDQGADAIQQSNLVPTTPSASPVTPKVHEIEVPLMESVPKTPVHKVVCFYSKTGNVHV